MKPHRDDVPLGEQLVDAVSEEELAASWRGVQEGRARRRRRRTQRRWVGAALTVAALAIAGHALMNVDDAPAVALTRVDGGAFVGVGPNEAVSLSDGSRVESHGGAIDVLENGADVVALHLRGGRARFEVTPGTGRRWRVETGGVSVDVVGTVFTVERSADAIEVAVQRGAVVVRGARVPDGVARLAAGRSVRVSLDVVAAGAPDSALERAALPAPERATDDPRAAGSTPRPAEDARDETAARSDEADETARPRATGPSDGEGSAPRRLLRAADRARLAGRRDDAITSLTTLVTAHPGSREAPLAAFTAARLLRESSRDDEARAWYRRALALGLPAPLDEQARGALRELQTASE